MNYIKFPENFLELEDEFSNYETSKVAVLPVPYEKTTTYMKGAAKGPGAILKASRQVELYNEELGKNMYDMGICTLNELRIEEKPELMVNVVYENVKKLIDDNKFPVVIGGEHSITPGCIKAFAGLDGFSILQLDAHADLREEYNGTKFSHACAMKRCLDICKNIVQVGIRSLCDEEADFIKENKLKIFWAKDIFDNDKWFDEAISKLSKNVYITLDLDVFDPSIMPSTGTPEPGGMWWYQYMTFINKVIQQKNVVGFDVVELAPVEGSPAPDFLAAKMIYQMLCKIYAKKGKK